MNHEKLSKRLSRKYALGAISAAALALGASGCSTTKVSYNDAKHKADERFEKTFKQASPAGKFLIQYLRVTKVAEVRYEGWDNAGMPAKTEFRYGKACLEGTAYDIAGGSVSASAVTSGLFSTSRVTEEGNVPTAAAYAQVDSDHPDVMLVRSGHTNSADLYFNNVHGDGRLEPADKTTKDILLTYGCENDWAETHKTFKFGNDAETSPYIVGN